MTPSEFGKIIKNDIHGFFLFYGEEYYLKRHYFNLAEKSVTLDGSNLVNMSGEGKTLSDLCREITVSASIPSMDMNKRMIRVYDIEWSKVNDEQLGFLEDCVNDVSSFDDILVIIDTRPENFNAGTFKKPSKLFVKLSKIIECVYFPKETPARLAPWIQRHFKADSIDADLNVCQKLIQYCGSDMTTLKNEINKLCAYVLQDKRNVVTEQDVQKICSYNNEIDAFDFSNAILNGNRDRAFEILTDMMRRKEQPEMIMGTIISIYSDLYTVKILTQAGMQRKDIAKKTSMHEYRVGIYADKSSGLSKAGLEKALTLCKEADFKIKSANTDSYCVIEVLLIKLFMIGKIR